MNNPHKPTRRDLLVSGTAAAVIGATPVLGRRGESREVLKVGLIGCGGRGTGAAAQALRADPNTKLVALADAFPDALENSLRTLSGTADIADRVDVTPENQFVGFDAYKGVIDNCDVVLLATSPHFRPLHVEAAVNAGKHLFVEKPVATDGPGLRRIWAACDKAKEQGTVLVSGLCYRYEFKKQETVKRIHDGAIGEITAMQTSYNTGGLWHKGRKPEWSDMEYQMRNWLYFGWLSGDHIAEQHIHSLDKIAWTKGSYPTKCVASGGRIQRTDEKYGNIYDHFNTTYEWEDGVRAFSSCRQISGAASDVSDWIYGTKGKANIQAARIWAAEDWRYRGDAPDDMYQNEHNRMFEAIRAGEVIHNGDYMCESTLMAIMGRMAAYTGASVTREAALNSELDLSPAAYEWSDLEMRPISIPGVTKFI
jgi:predicted dehydrogenase